jgi:hypothetical protein
MPLVGAGSTPTILSTGGTVARKELAKTVRKMPRIVVIVITERSEEVAKYGGRRCGF